MKKDFNLIKRFIKDNSLPIPIIGEGNYFDYFINLYEKDYNSLTKYNSLCGLVDGYFNHSTERFLEKYYEIRDNIIKTVENSDAYKRFNTMDMNSFTYDIDGISSNNIYCEINNGKTFVSFDLKKANFQALKYVDEEIVMGASTYEDFIRNFTDIDYIINSKHIRQIVFGKMNPKRHIMIEKYITANIYKELVDKYGMENCVSMMNDELIFRVDNLDEKGKYDIIGEQIKNNMGFDINVELFSLNKIQLLCNKVLKGTYYYKEYIPRYENNTIRKIMCVPVNYFAIVYKLLNNLELKEEDLHFGYEGIDCRYCERFRLIKDIIN